MIYNNHQVLVSYGLIAQGREHGTRYEERKTDEHQPLCYVPMRQQIWWHRWRKRVSPAMRQLILNPKTKSLDTIHEFFIPPEQDDIPHKYVPQVIRSSS